jgi:hypothetical protein
MTQSGAQLLRSYVDADRSLAHSAGRLRLTISQNYPARKLATIIVPIAVDDLDLSHAQAPEGLHLAAWSR